MKARKIELLETVKFQTNILCHLIQENYRVIQLQIFAQFTIEIRFIITIMANLEMLLITMGFLTKIPVGILWSFNITQPFIAKQRGT